MEATYTAPDCRRAPMLLIQVCAYWRNLVLRSPQFGGFLTLNANRPRVPLAILKEFMLRAQNRPLSFDLKGAEGAERNLHVPGTLLDDLFALPQFHETVKHLRIRCDSHRIYGFPWNCIGPVFPALRTLQLGNGDLFARTCLNFFSQAPHLEKLSVGSSRSSLGAFLVPIWTHRFPWTHICSLSLEFAGDKSFLTDVRLALPVDALRTTLVHCRLVSKGVISHVASPTDSNLPVVFQALQRLEVLGTGPHGLRLFTTPGLLSLTVEFGDLGSQDVVRAFYDRSQFSLESLEVLGGNWYDVAGVANAAWLLQSNPQIKGLCTVDLWEEELVVLANQIANSFPPSLQMFKLSVVLPQDDGAPGWASVLRALLVMLSKHNSEVACVEIVAEKYIDCRGSSEVVKEQLEALIKESES
ncbi:hypothetical protein C8F01DRAFT_1152392 [Mycena amicta]|nr:hypothetical protein C8F01DRAFT_1152392 [Mycena amicta]